MEIQLSQHLSWKPVLFSLNGLGRLVKNQLHAFISRLHILFHQSICPIFMPITQCFDYCRFLTFETKHVSPPTIFSGFQESLAIVGPLQMKSPLAFPFLQNSNWEFWLYCIEHVDYTGWFWHCDKMKFLNPWTRAVFNFFQQCFVLFSV